MHDDMQCLSYGCFASDDGCLGFLQDQTGHGTSLMDRKRAESRNDTWRIRSSPTLQAITLFTIQWSYQEGRLL